VQFEEIESLERKNEKRQKWWIDIDVSMMSSEA